MGAGNGLGRYSFSAAGRVYGVVVGICGRLYVVGVCQRGLFWRFGARVYRPIDGYWESVFGLRSRIKAVEMMFIAGMKDEIIPVAFRPNRIHGSIHFSRSGVINFVIVALDNERFAAIDSKTCQSFAADDELSTSVYSREKWN